MDEAKDRRTWQRLWELIWGCAISQAIHVAVELKIPELLEHRSLSAERLAEETKSDAWALEAVLRALVGFEILSVDVREEYSLGESGRLLLASSPATFAGEAGVFFETLYRPLEALIDMVKTGRVAFDQVYGMSFYEYLTSRPALADFFHDTMTRNSVNRYAELSSVYDFTKVSRVVDIGGGEGALMAQLLRENPHVHGVLFDLPHAIDRAIGHLKAAGVAERCELVSGSFLESVPAGGDLYLLAQILNNWRDDEARLVLQNCRNVMKLNARMLVLEAVHSPGVSAAPWRTLVSVGVMAQRGGRTRNVAQHHALFGSAGLKIRKIHQFPNSETCAIDAAVDR
jgi:hypothetical protein